MVELIKEKWTNSINIVTIGATNQEGGTRSKAIRIGGQNSLPFMFDEGSIPNRPVIAMEVLDHEPKDWPDILKKPFKDVLRDPVLWAKACVDEYKADLLCITLQGIHPDFGNRSVDDESKLLKDILKEVSVPLIIAGCGDKDKDNIVLAEASQVVRGEKVLFGFATQDNYKTLTASCMADGHSIIAESPIDINIAKQVNILINDMGFDINRIVMHPSTASLGYGMEYVYSIIERARLASLGGDKMLAMPFIVFIGQEVYRSKEATATEDAAHNWGELEERAPLWEAISAVSMLHSGADIVVMRHPKAVETVREYIEITMKG